jgi:hypothetical protein
MGARMAEDLHVSPESFEISRSNALVPLLVLFAATVLAIVATIVHGKPFIPPAGAPADRAYGPGDFPAIYGDDEALRGLAPAGSTGTAALFPVPKPPFSEGMFPCMECHKDLVPSAERRKLRDPHDDIVLHHDEEHRWCLDCHDAKDRDHLRLASGALVEFTESYKLCGQCHGTQYRDWRSGIHGKRTGFWDGAKRYLLCVNCHNPHSPHFAPLKPLPPPIRPQLVGEKSHATAAQ